MPDIYTDAQDERAIGDVLLHGLGTPRAPKLRVLRIALARSLQIPTPPGSELDGSRLGGSEYALERITGAGQSADEEGRRDYDLAVRALLSIYHGEDMFHGEEADHRYRRYLQRHVRRGLQEIRTTWRPGHDFHGFLYHELFGAATTRPVRADLGQQILAGLREIGVSAQIRGVDNGPRISRYRVYLDDVNHYDKVKRGLDKLGLHLGLSTRQGILLQEDEGPVREARVLALDVPRPAESWHTIPGARLREWATQANDVPTLTVWPGVDVLGEPVHFDLGAAPHLLVGGTTGSGKSVCLHALLLSLLWRLAPQDLQLTLIDPKRVELAQYAAFPQVAGGEVVEDIGDALEILQQLVDEMERRTLLLRQHEVANLSEGRAQGGIDLPYVVVVVEELADLLFQSREAEAPLVRLAQKARAVGIHLVLATQRPDADTFSGLLRTNVPGRIALSVRTGAESKIILDETGAEKLLGAGDMLLRPQAGARARRAHGVRVGSDDIRLCLQSVRGRSQ
ncbi:FtsK/SpoIIIE domain-containing protein [Accumulibacter sp.]|uniref:FtsK/SpoIIIE domain-containing protein n=1 Tax=Accumulibacter sp. TaxID=2053492 RepID=UPI0026023EFF|nr:FtsK/SpoIIIE domain-containing protein [Accumulibacter sp.]